MRIRIIPPHNSALDLYFIPKRLPIFTPAAEQTKVITPIKDTADTISTFRKANIKKNNNKIKDKLVKITLKW